jgi:hypothetical protein
MQKQSSRSSALSIKKLAPISLIFILLLHAPWASAVDLFHSDNVNNYENVRNWKEFSQDVADHTAREQQEGIVYMATGALALVGGVAGYFSSQDPFAKAAFSLTESLGIAGVGYGAYEYNIGGSDRAFENIISNSSTLSAQQRDDILQHFLAEKKLRKEKSKNILMLTYGAIAAANLVNATHETDPALRTGLYFLSAFNALGLLSLTF